MRGSRGLGVSKLSMKFLSITMNLVNGVFLFFRGERCPISWNAYVQDLSIIMDAHNCPFIYGLKE